MESSCTTVQCLSKPERTHTAARRSRNTVRFIVRKQITTSRLLSFSLQHSRFLKYTLNMLHFEYSCSIIYANEIPRPRGTINTSYFFPPNRLLRNDDGTQRRSSLSGACTPPFDLHFLFFATFGDVGRAASACGAAVRCVAAWALVASFLPISASTSLKLPFEKQREREKREREKNPGPSQCTIQTFAVQAQQPVYAHADAQVGIH